jgi:SAM-dependent methyltransferase
VAHLVDLSEVKLVQQRTWTAGDYSVVGGHINWLAEALVEAADLRAGQQVLDVATGSGNAALAAARRNGEVTGVDYVPELLERARLRADVEQLPVTFVDGDVEDLPFDDASFDVVISVVGVMFASDPDRAAAELLRVCRPGGTVALASWTPDSLIARQVAAITSRLPSAAGGASPFTWGQPELVRSRFGNRVSELSMARRVFRFRYPSAQALLGVLRTTYGPVLRAFDALPTDEQESLSDDLLALYASENRSADGTLAIDSPYLEVIARRSS